MRSLYTSYIDTKTAYSECESVKTDVSVISGNRGSTDGRWGIWRFGRFGANEESCIVLPKRNLACFLVIWGVVQRGGLGGMFCASGGNGSAVCMRLSSTADLPLDRCLVRSRDKDPGLKLKMAHWFFGPVV